MRSLVFLLVLVLFCSVRETSSSTYAIRSAQSVCCKGFTDKNIPLKRIVSYQWTTTDCPFQKAIVYKTVLGKEICVDPEDTLVIRQVATLDSRTKVQKKLKV